MSSSRISRSWSISNLRDSGNSQELATQALPDGCAGPENGIRRMSSGSSRPGVGAHRGCGRGGGDAA